MASSLDGVDSWGLKGRNEKYWKRLQLSTT